MTTLPPPPARTVHVTDATHWLKQQGALAGCSVITSLPDISEVPIPSLPEWKAWFTHVAEDVLRIVPVDGVAVFYQTDIKVDGCWVDKAYLVMRAADALGIPLLFHKIVCRVPAGTITFGRPAYAHMLAFSSGVRLDLARSTADVLPQLGEMTWSRAMGVEACKAACRFILDHAPSTRTVVDPFCGMGTALAVANAMGLDAVGVELSKKRAKRARNLVVDIRSA